MRRASEEQRWIRRKMKVSGEGGQSEGSEEKRDWIDQ